MKKTVSVLLSAALLMGVAALPAAAADSYVLGDVNMDGKVDTKDALIALSDYAQCISLDGSTLSKTQFALADVNKSGRVDAIDASYILQFYVLHDLAGMDTLTMDVLVAQTGDVDYEQLARETLDGYTIVHEDASGNTIIEYVKK